MTETRIKAQKRKRVAFRLAPELADRLAAQAQYDGRTVNEELELLVRWLLSGQIKSLAAPEPEGSQR
jgi:hypothetical protein